MVEQKTSGAVPCQDEFRFVRSKLHEVIVEALWAVKIEPLTIDGEINRFSAETLARKAVEAIIRESTR